MRVVVNCVDSQTRHDLQLPDGQPVPDVDEVLVVAVADGQQLVPYRVLDREFLFAEREAGATSVWLEVDPLPDDEESSWARGTAFIGGSHGRACAGPRDGRRV